MSVRDWINNLNIKNTITLRGGSYKYNYRTGGTPGSVDPRWFNTNAGVQRKIKRNKYNKAGWKSPEENYTERDDYILQFKFKRATRINNISFELLDYSHQWSIRYYDSYRKTMVPVEFRNNNNTLSPLNGVITSNSGDWKYFNYNINKIKASVFEVRLKRNWYPNPNTPQPPTKYSLGLKNLSFKFISDGTEGAEEDRIVPGPNGFNEIIYYKHHDAYNAIDTSTFGELYDDKDKDDNPIEAGTIDESTVIPNTNSYWMSAPQGAAESVVSLYCDLRTSSGESQTFNALRMLPLQIGPKMTAYYSNDDTVTNFAISSNKFNVLTSSNTAKSRTTKEGFLCDGAYNYYCENQKANFDSTSNFTIGTEVKFVSNLSSTTARCLWQITNDSSDLSLNFKPDFADTTLMTGHFQIIGTGGVNILASTATYLQNPIEIEFGVNYGIIVSYNYDKAIWNIDFAPITGDITETIKQTHTIGGDTSPISGSNVFLPTKILFGNRRTNGHAAYAYTRRLWVKQDPYFESVSDAFFGDIEAFSNGDLDVPTSRRSISYNSLLVGNFVDNGLVSLGPNGGYYANKTWVPIPKDFTLVNTDYQFDQTYNAKYLKLEFTGLMPRFYQSSSSLPIRGFPQRVRSWFDDLFEESEANYSVNGPIDRFEGTTGINTNPTPVRGFTNIYDNINSGNQNEFIFNRTLSSYDAVNSLPDDVVSLSRELRKASIHMRFPTVGRHSYELSWAPPGKTAYFVGIKDLQVYRSTQTKIRDDVNIYDYMDDDSQTNEAESDLGSFDENYNLWFSRTDLTPESYPTEVSATITSKAFESYSKFRTLQMAVLDSSWQTCMGDAVANLDTIEFLKGINTIEEEDDYESYPFNIVTSSFQGRRGGEVILIARESFGDAEYGLKIEPLVDTDGTGHYPGNYSNTNSLPMIHAQTSAAVRMYLPETSNGTYELRLWETSDYTKDPEADPEEWHIAARKVINIPARNWVEEEITYMPNSENTAENWYTEIVQIDPSIDEPFLVDMLGIWQRPVTWEVTNNPDDGVAAKWYPVLFPLNNPNAYFSFPLNDYGNFGVGPDVNGRYEPMRLAVRATAKTGGVFLGAYQVVPWYEGSPGVNRAPIDYNPPWGVSDSEDLRAVIHKSLFQGWYHYFPLHDSTVFQENPLSKYTY